MILLKISSFLYLKGKSTFEEIFLDVVRPTCDRMLKRNEEKKLFLPA